MTIRKAKSVQIGRHLLDRNSVLAKTSLSSSTLDRLEAMELFPRRIQVTYSRVAWNSEAVDAWIAERIAASAANTHLNDDAVQLATAPIGQLERQMEARRSMALKAMQEPVAKAPAK